MDTEMKKNIMENDDTFQKDLFLCHIDYAWKTYEVYALIAASQAGLFPLSCLQVG